MSATRDRLAQQGSAAGAAAVPAPLSTSLGGLEVVICCGSGGVGKTTVSAALAAAMARTAGRRVMVLTVDPARRLYAALGIRSAGPDAVVVPAAYAEHVAAAGAEQERLEEWIMSEVAKGVALPGLYPPDAATRARYEARLAETGRNANHET